MRIGISLSSTRPTGDPAAGAASIIARARAAEAADLDSVTMGDHHAMSVPYFQNTPMLGRLMAELSPRRPVGCLFLLPLWHPVLAAEQVATLATMSEAPFIVQTGIGSGQQQFEAMGRSLRTRGAVLEESIRVMKELLTGGTVSSEVFDVVDASISPIAPHGVMWWLGAGVDTALERAAKLGDAWYTTPHFTPEQLEAPMRTYEAFCEKHGTRPRTVLRKDVLILEDGDRACALGAEIATAGYRGMQLENLVVGGVENTFEQLSAFADLGVDEVAVRCMSMDDSIAIETIECCGELRRRLAAHQGPGTS